MKANFAGLGFEPGELAVVTGAASGIGRATATMLARSGVAVSAWDLQAEFLGDVVAEIEAQGGRAQAVVTDLTEGTAIDRAWEQTDALGLPVRYLVNNAGPMSTDPLSVAEGCVLGVGSMVAVTEGWLARHSDEASSVTFTASIAGNAIGAGRGQAWYPAAKAGMAGYMRWLAEHQRGRPPPTVWHRVSSRRGARSNCRSCSPRPPRSGSRRSPWDAPGSQTRWPLPSVSCCPRRRLSSTVSCFWSTARPH